MNDENLKRGEATRFKSGEEAARNGHKGGIASGKARRKKRDMREAAKVLLDAEVKNSRLRRKMKDNGIDDDDLTNQMAVLLSMFMSAVNGNVRAAEFLRDIAGYGPNSQPEAPLIDNSTKEMEDYLEQQKKADT